VEKSEQFFVLPGLSGTAEVVVVGATVVVVVVVTGERVVRKVKAS